MTSTRKKRDRALLSNRVALRLMGSRLVFLTGREFGEDAFDPIGARLLRHRFLDNL